MKLPRKLGFCLRAARRRLCQVIKYPHLVFNAFGALLRRSRLLTAWFKASKVWDRLMAPSRDHNSVFPQARPRVETLENRQMPSGLSTGSINSAFNPQAAGASQPNTLVRTSTLLDFEPNTGQAPAAFDFIAQNGIYTADLSPTAAVINIGGPSAPDGSSDSTRAEGSTPQSIGVRFVGGNSAAAATAESKYSGIDYTSVYDGIDLIYQPNSQNLLEYTMVVHPGASPAQIRMAFTGAKSISLDSNGNLVLTAAAGTVTQEAPTLYQIGQNGDLERVKGGFEILNAGAVSFAVGSYDPTRALYIDPYYIWGSGDSYVAVSPNPSLLGNSVTINVHLSIDGLSGDPPGSVSLEGVPGVAGSYDLVLLPGGNGHLYYTTIVDVTSLPIGDDIITAVYAGVAVPGGPLDLSRTTAVVDIPEITSPDTDTAEEGNPHTFVLSSSAFTVDDDSVGGMFDHPHFSVIAGSLPPGLTITVDPSSGNSEITGIPASMTSLGMWTFTLEAENVTGLYAGALTTQVFTLDVTDAPLDPRGIYFSDYPGDIYTGIVGWFHDEDTLATAGLDYTATIDWGDGHITSGTVAYDPHAEWSSTNLGMGRVIGSHAYAAVGDYLVSATVYDPGGESTIIISTAVVSPDPPLDGYGLDISAVEGTPYTGSVAEFHDEDPMATGDTNYTAEIDWGDGSGSSGSVTYDGDEGLGTVTGTHVYEDEGNYTTEVTIYDPDGAIGFAFGSAWVKDAPLGLVSLIGNGVPFTASVGDEVTTAVASVMDVDADVVVTPGDVTALIDWGDGTSPTVGEIEGSDGDFSIVGTHTYDQEGAYLVTALVTDTVSNLSQLTRATGLIFDNESEMTDTGVGPLEITMGASAVVDPVAEFTDSNPDAEASDFATPVIDWGDGSAVTTGTVEADGDAFAVVGDGAPPYQVPGKYLIRTEIEDDETGPYVAYTTIVVDPLVSGTMDLAVADPVLQTGAMDVAFDTLATFDGSSNQTASGFDVLINWGDGSGWRAATAEGGGGSFELVDQMHDYDAFGDYPVLVEVQDGTRSELRATTVALLPELGTITLDPPIEPTNQELKNVIIGTFNPPDDVPLTDYQVEIYWGDDGTDPSEGQLAQVGDHTYIIGSHTYEDDSADDEKTIGHLSMLVVITGLDGSELSTACPITTTAWQENADVPDDLPVLTFKDERLDVDPEGAAAFTATIDWIDESGPTVVAGDVVATGVQNYYQVMPVSMTFGEEGISLFTVQTEETDASPAYDASLLVDDPTYLVADTPLTEDSATDIFGTVGVDLGADITVATFGDPDPLAVDELDAGSPGDAIGAYTASIDWGDGTGVELGTVQISESGDDFAVISEGGHTYADPGVYLVNVAIWDDGGADMIIQGSATIRSTSDASFGLSAVVRGNDPARADLLPFGNATIALNTGGVRIAAALDFDQSPGTSVGGNPMLSYNSETLGYGPMVEVSVAPDVSLGIGDTITGQLTWNGGAPNNPITFTVVETSPANEYIIQLPVNELDDGALLPAVGAAWNYDYSVDVVVRSGGNSYEETLEDQSAPVVVQNVSQFGVGWNLSETSRLIVGPGSVMRVFGTGDMTLFTENADGAYVSQDGDFGALTVAVDVYGHSAFIYTDLNLNSWVYDGDGRLIYGEDRHDLLTSYVYDDGGIGGLLSAIETPDGGVTQFMNNEGLTTAIFEPGLRFVTLEHEYNSLSEIDDPEDYSRGFIYSGNLLTGDQWGLELTTFAYDPFGAVASIDRGDDITLSVSPAADNLLVTNGVLLDAPLAFPVNPYNFFDAPTATTTDGTGAVTTVQLDALGRLEKQENPDLSTEDWALNANGDPLSYTDPNGYTTDYTYESISDPTYLETHESPNDGNVVETNYPDGSADTAAYDAEFHLLTMSEDGDGNITDYALGTQGDVTMMVDPLGITSYVWSDGELESMTDPDGNSTTYLYDAELRLTEVIDPAGDTTQTGYDINGNPATTMDETGDTTTISFDGLGRLSSITDPDGHTTIYLYDAPGNVNWVVMPNGELIENIFDAAGVETGEDDEYRDTTNLIDDDGNVTLSVDPLHRATATLYNDDNMPTEVITGQWAWITVGVSGGFVGHVRVVEYAYDDDQNITLTIDTGGTFSGGILTLDSANEATGDVYDSMDRLITETLGVWSGSIAWGGFTGPTRTTSYAYDHAGNLTLTIDTIDSSDQQATETRYDGDNLPTTVTVGAWDSTTSSFVGAVETALTEYDAAGQATGQVDADGNLVTTVYDQDGRVEWLIEPVDSGAKQGTESLYNNDNELTETIQGIATGSGTSWGFVGPTRQTKYDYDQAGNPTETIDPDSVQTDEIYNSLGDVTKTIEGAESAAPRTTESPEDIFGEPTESVDGLNHPTTETLDADGEVTLTTDPLGNFDYTLYDAFGQVTATITGVPAANTLSADALLVTTGSWDATEFQFDDFGDVTGTIDGANLGSSKERLTTTLFDAFGDATETVDADGRTTQYLMDLDGRATETIDPLNHQSYSFFDIFGDLTVSVAGVPSGSTRSLDQLLTPGAWDATEYAFDADGNPTETIDGANLGSSLERITTMLVNGAGETTETIDPLGRKAYDFYDVYGNVTTTITGVAPSNSMSVGTLMSTAGAWDVVKDAYDGDDNLTMSTDGANSSAPRLTTQLFDDFGDVTETINALNHASYQSFDADGQLTKAVDADGNKSFDAYNADGELTITVTGVPSTNSSPVDVLMAATGIWDVVNSKFDAAGDVTETIDGYNLGSGQRRITTTTFDVFGDSLETIDPLGRQSYALYDSDGFVTATVSGVRADNALLATQLLAASGAWDATEDMYDADGNLTETVDGANLGSSRSTTMDYDGLGDVTSTTDPLGRVTTNDFDQFGELTKSVDPAGNKSYDLYDGDGEVTATVSGVPGSNTSSATSLLSSAGAWDATERLFNAAGQATETIDGANLSSGSRRIGYAFFNEFGDMTETVDPAGAATTMLVDADGQTTETIAGSIRKDFQVFDADGNVTAIVSGVPFSNTSAVSTLMGSTGIWDVIDQQFDSAGNLTGTIDGANLSTPEISTSTFDEFGDLTQSIDPRGFPSYFGFDVDGELTAAVTDVPNSGVPTTLTGLIDSVGAWNVTEDEYDAAGNVTKTIDGANLAPTLQVDTTDSYDPFGNLTKTVDSLGNTTVNVYDADNELTQVDNPSGDDLYSFDLDGNQTMVTDPDGNHTTFVFDSMNLVTHEIDPTGDVVTYQYDEFSDLTQRNDSLGDEIDYNYDHDGRELSETWLLTGTVTNIETFTYDALGQVLIAQDYNSIYEYTYDAAGHETSSDNESLTTTRVDEWPGVVLLFTYDEFGNRTGVHDGLGDLQTSTYNQDNELVSRAQTGAFGFGTGSSGSGYGGSGSSGSGHGGGSGGSGSGPVVEDTTGGTLLVDWTYTPDGQISTVTDYGDLAATDMLAKTQDSYDDDGRMVTQMMTDGSGDLDLIITYAYNDANQLASEDDNGTLTSYTYDTNGELTGNGTLAIGYDANGNRDSSGYTLEPGGANEIKSDGTWTYTYDERGDVTGKSNASGIDWDYSYNVADQMVKAKETLDGSVVDDISYTFDVYGNLIRRVETGRGAATDQVYAYDGWKTDQDASGNSPSYIGQENWDIWGVFTTTGASSATGGAYYKDQFYRLESLQVFGNSVNSVAGELDAVPVGPDTVNVFTTDYQGSVRAVVDNGGAVVNSLTYNGFIVETESSPGVGLTYGAQGMLKDESSGLYVDHGRVLDPNLDRFMQQDPMSFGGGSMNLEEFAGNAPTDGSDPSGDDTVVQDPDGGWRWVKGQFTTGKLPSETLRIGSYMGVGSAGWARVGQTAIDLKTLKEMAASFEQLVGDSAYSKFWDNLSDERKLQAIQTYVSFAGKFRSGMFARDFDAEKVREVIGAPKYPGATSPSARDYVEALPAAGPAIQQQLKSLGSKVAGRAEALHDTMQSGLQLLDKIPGLNPYSDNAQKLRDLKEGVIDAAEATVDEMVTHRRSEAAYKSIQDWAKAYVEKWKNDTAGALLDLGLNAAEYALFAKLTDAGRLDELPSSIRAKLKEKAPKTAPRTAGYKDLTAELKGTGEQANHLNQNAVYKGVIPEEQGLANGMRGNAFTEAGTPHYEFHRSLESFWNQYRPNGPLAGTRPTNAQYGQALEQALRAGGYSAEEAANLAAQAAQQRAAYGLGGTDLVPRIPRRINQTPPPPR